MERDEEKIQIVVETNIQMPALSVLLAQTIACTIGCSQYVPIVCGPQMSNKTLLSRH